MKKLILFTALIFLCCEKNLSRIPEINSLTGFNFPATYKVAYYYKDYETQTVFKIIIPKKDIVELVKKHNFVLFNIYESNPIKKHNPDLLFIMNLQNSFIPAEEILDQKGLYYVMSNGTFLVLSTETSELWGSTTYE